MNFDPAFRVSLWYWALTGLLTTGLKVRAGSETAPWLSQPAFTLRLYPPGCPFWEDAGEASDPIRSVWLDFTGGERIGLERFIDETRGYATFEDPEGVLVQHVQRMARSAGDLGDSGYWQMQAELLKVVVFLNGALKIKEGVYRVVGGSPLSGADPVVARARRYLAAHLGLPVRIQDVARHAGASVPTLERRYKSVTGESPMRTLAQWRLEQAKELLLNGVNLKTIAERTCFCDAFHLSKTFKRYEGVSPREFLRRAGSRGDADLQHVTR